MSSRCKRRWASRRTFAARAIDLADVSRMVGRASPEDVTEARALVAQLGNTDDVADFDRLVQMGRLERSREIEDR